jgi:hypothetical protein
LLCCEYDKKHKQTCLIVTLNNVLLDSYKRLMSSAGLSHKVATLDVAAKLIHKNPWVYFDEFYDGMKILEYKLSPLGDFPLIY